MTKIFRSKWWKSTAAEVADIFSSAVTTPPDIQLIFMAFLAASKRDFESATKTPKPRKIVYRVRGHFATEAAGVVLRYFKEVWQGTTAIEKRVKICCWGESSEYLDFLLLL